MSEENKKKTSTFKDLVEAVLENPQGSKDAKLRHCIFHYQGYRGRVMGTPTSGCPYEPNTREFYSWQLGWTLADNELEAINQLKENENG